MLLLSHEFLVAALMAEASDRQIVAAPGRAPRDCGFQWPWWSLRPLFDRDVNPGELKTSGGCLDVSLSV